MSTVNFNPRDRCEPGTFAGHLRIRLMARSGGYVMARAGRGAPFVLTEKQWAKLPLFEEGER